MNEEIDYGFKNRARQILRSMRHQTKFLFSRTSSSEKYLKDISIPLIAGVVSGLYVRSSLSQLFQIGIVIGGVIMIFLLSIFLDLMNNKKGLRSTKVKAEIRKSLEQDELRMCEIVENLSYPEHKVCYNLQDLEKSGKVISNEQTEEKYTLIGNISEQRTGGSVEKNISPYPPEI